jgi:hypothetical protein
MPDTPFRRLSRPSVSSNRFAYAPVHCRLIAAINRHRALQVGHFRPTRRQIHQNIPLLSYLRMLISK